MDSEKKGTNIWELIGKLGALIGLIWVAIQIYSFFAKSDFVADVHGEQMFYKTAPSFVKSYTNSRKLSALIGSALRQGEELRDTQLYRFALKNIFKDTIADSLLKDYKKTIAKIKWADSYELDNNVTKANDYESKYNYNSMWRFIIKNNGNNPFDELSLELPVSGYYEIIFPDASVKSGLFNKSIAVGNLNPTYQCQIYVWSNEDEYSLKEHENNSKFTYKNGYFIINYGVIATGFFAWLISVWSEYKFLLVLLACAIIFMISLMSILFKSTKVSENKSTIPKTRQPKMKQKDADEKIN